MDKENNCAPSPSSEQPARVFESNRYVVLRNREGIADSLRWFASLASEQLPRGGDDNASLLRQLWRALQHTRDADRRYFVLRYDCPNGEPADPAARLALARYAGLIRDDSMVLSNGLLSALRETDPRIQHDEPVTNRTHTSAMECLDAEAGLIAAMRPVESDPDALLKDMLLVIQRHGLRVDLPLSEMRLAGVLARAVRAAVDEQHNTVATLALPAQEIARRLAKTVTDVTWTVSDDRLRIEVSFTLLGTGRSRSHTLSDISSDIPEGVDAEDRFAQEVVLRTCRDVAHALVFGTVPNPTQNDDRDMDMVDLVR